MSLYRLTIKNTSHTNGEIVEKGMSAEIASQSYIFGNKEGQDKIQQAFMNKYGVDLKKVNMLSSNYFITEKIN